MDEATIQKKHAETLEMTQVVKADLDAHKPRSSARELPEKYFWSRYHLSSDQRNFCH